MTTVGPDGENWVVDRMASVPRIHIFSAQGWPRGKAMIFVLATLIGIVAGLRTMLPPAVVSWAARLGALHLQGTWLAFLGKTWVTFILTAFAISELVLDQLPTMPSRTSPLSFTWRLASGALTGAAIGADRGRWLAGAAAGMVGAAIGTLAGHAARLKLAATLGRDRPAALVEDLVALAGALVAAWA